MRSILCTLACLLAVVSPVLAAELVDNPAYTMWAKYKPGTSITLVQDSKMGPMTMSAEITQTLKEVTPEKATIEMTISSPMMPTAQKQTTSIPSKVEPDKAFEPGKLPPGAKGEVKSLGREKVKVGDKEYDCEVTQFTAEQNGTRMTGKSWSTDQVPGNMVKVESSGSMGSEDGEDGPQGEMKMTMTLKKVEIK